MSTRWILMPFVFGMAVATAATQETGKSQDSAKEELKRLEGLWKIEKAQEKGEDVGPGDEALYIEDGKILWTNKAGTDRSGQTANLKVDPNKDPKSMDCLITRGSFINKK